MVQPPHAREALAGVDGCRGGWVVALRTPPTGIVTVTVVPDVPALVRTTRRCAAVALDMPIGLPDTGPRACDTLTRAALGPRRASVFPAPPRAVLGATTYAEACERARQATGRALSQQAFNLLPKITAVDSALRADPDWAARVHEVHPELAFACLDAGRPMAHPKRDPRGAAARRARIDVAFPEDFEHARAAIPRRDAADDDLLDALACLWSAGRIAARGALRLPEDAPRDAAGLPMQIQA